MYFDIAFVDTPTEITKRSDPEGTNSDPHHKTASYTKILELQDTQKVTVSGESELILELLFL